MREVALGDAGKVLLVKEDNQFKAIGNKCTHYGAPLKDGVRPPPPAKRRYNVFFVIFCLLIHFYILYAQTLCNGRVRCPWHGACFNTSTGDIEDSPGLDSVHSFKVRVEGEDVIVAAPVGELKVWKRTPRVGSCSAADTRVFVIIGGGTILLRAQTLSHAHTHTHTRTHTHTHMHHRTRTRTCAHDLG
jgi:nitrite reductase/ring-hydroxylating ferredoxin subunit